MTECWGKSFISIISEARLLFHEFCFFQCVYTGLNQWVHHTSLKSYNLQRKQKPRNSWRSSRDKSFGERGTSLSRSSPPIWNDGLPFLFFSFHLLSMAVLNNARGIDSTHFLVFWTSFASATKLHEKQKPIPYFRTYNTCPMEQSLLFKSPGACQKLFHATQHSLAQPDEKGVSRELSHPLMNCRRLLDLLVQYRREDSDSTI